MNAISRSHGVSHFKVAMYLEKKFPSDLYEISIDEDIEQDEGHLKVRPDILIRDKKDDIVLVAEIAVNSLKKDLKGVKAIYEMFEIKDYLVVDCNHNTIYHFGLKDGKYEELQGSNLSDELEKNVFE